MPDEPETDETAPEVSAVIVVPEEPHSPDYAARIAALEARVAALEATRIEETDNDGSDAGNANAGDDTGSDGEAETEAAHENGNERPITRHWLFGPIWRK